MNRIFIGIKPTIYVKDGSEVTFYLDLTGKDYKIEEITQVTFLFSQDNEVCVFHQLFNADGFEPGAGYDEENNRLYRSFVLGTKESDTESFELNKPIRFEIAIDFSRRLETDELDSMQVETKTVTEVQPDIILTVRNLEPDLISAVRTGLIEEA